MQRRSFFPQSFILPLFAVALAASLGEAQTRRPNLLFIFMEDMGTEMISDGRYKLIHNLLGNGELKRGYPATKSDLILSGAPQGSPARQAFERAGQPPEFELYDLQEDPGEIYNLAGKAESVAIESKLKSALLHWRAEIVGDPLLDPAFLQEFVEHNRRESSEWSDSPKAKRYKMDQERWITPWDASGYGRDPAIARNQVP